MDELGNIRRTLVFQVAQRAKVLSTGRDPADSSRALVPTSLSSTKTLHGLEALREVPNSRQSAVPPPPPRRTARIDAEIDAEIANLARRCASTVKRARTLAQSGRGDLIVAVIVGATSLTAATQTLSPFRARSLREAKRRRLAQSLGGGS